jgi:hypothetical protein
MRTQRQQPATRVLLALAVVLGSLWVGGPAARPADTADRLAAIHTQPGFEPAVLRDRAPALRPSVGRSDPSGRSVPLLLGMLVAALAVAGGMRVGRSRPGMARTRSLARSTSLGARSPPSLQPA